MSMEAAVTSLARQTLELMFHEGDVIIISQLARGKMSKQAFNSIERAADYVERTDRDDVEGTYVNLQKLKPGVTSDKRGDVQEYVRFLVDIDRKHKKNAAGKYQNASEEERKELENVANHIAKWVGGILGAQPMWCDTGNGFHLVWFLSLPKQPAVLPMLPTDFSMNVIRESLCAIKQRFESGNVEIDLSVGEPEQLVRLYGTWNRKADNLPDRPHRQSRILVLPTKTTTKSNVQLLAMEYQRPEATAKKKIDPDRERVNVEWAEEYGIEHWIEWAGEYALLNGTHTSDRGIHYMLDNCVWENEDGLHKHSGTAHKTEIIVHEDGGIGFSCFGSEDYFREQYPYKEKPTFPMLVKRINQLKGENYPHLIFPTHDEEDWNWSGALGIDFDDEPEAIDVEPQPEPPPREPEPQPEPPPREPEPQAEPRKPKKKLVRIGPAEGDYIVGVRASDIEPKLIRWLWTDKIPASALTIWTGKPDNGKSLSLLDITARVTRGLDWPDGSKNPLGPRVVLYGATEDDPSQILVPRLMAAGADLSKVVFPIAANRGGKDRKMNLKEDLDSLRYQIEHTPSIALLILDPLNSYWEGVDDNKAKDVRPVLDAVQKLCQETGLTVIGLVHSSKRTDGDSQAKVMGSSAIVQAGRAAWQISRDKDDPNKVRMAKVKGNSTKSRSGMTYHIESVDMMIEGEMSSQPRIVWDGQLDQTADDLMEEQRQQEREGKDTKMGLAKALLTTKLPLMGAEVMTQATNEGIGKRTLYNAADELCVHREWVKGKDRRWWLPEQWAKHLTGAEVTFPDRIVDDAVL